MFELNGVSQAPNMHMSYRSQENVVQDNLSDLSGKCPTLRKGDLQRLHVKMLWG